MKRRTLSNSLMVLLTLFIGVIALTAFKVVPDIYWFYMSDAFASEYHLNMKITFMVAESLLALLAVGIVIIIDLLNMFNKDETYTEIFTSRLKTLSTLCGVASIILVGVAINVFVIRESILYSFGIMAGILVMLAIVMIVGVVIALVRTIVMDAIEYKEENDLTV